MDSTSQGAHFISSILNRDITYKASPDDPYSFKNGLFEISQRPQIQFGLDIGVNIPYVYIDDIFNDVFDMNTAQSIGGVNVDNLISDGDYLACQGRGESKTKAGGTYNNTYCWVYRWSGDNIVSVTEYLDTEVLTASFGA